MGLIIVIYLLLGCLMDSLAMIILTIPIFYPVVLALASIPSGSASSSSSSLKWA
jgi:TRAP-type C4-dicarboxylate transport system permease large subunit